MSSLFYSHAFNFLSASERGVDPRTGQFNPATPIAKLVGNANLGPSLDITLSYDALLATNVGFGTGFSLKYSTYDIDQRRLTVSTGEVYIVDEDTSGVWLRQQGLENFRFERLPDAYKITHKSGDIELLSGPDTPDTIKVPFVIFSPAGHALNFDWSYSPEPRLTRISDERTDLLRISYESEISTVLHVWPDSKETYDVLLQFSSDSLTTIETLADGIALRWSFGYERVDDYYLLSQVATPTGLVETVSYTARLKFPDNAHLPSLPAVSRYVQDPGQGQPATNITYDYTPENYLGYGVDAAWHPDRDYLYGILTDYQYQSVETAQSDDALVTVTRTYNCFHLLVEQTERQASCEKKTHTTYHAIPNAPFDQQPPQFQLPRQIDTLYTDYAKPPGDQSRTERVETTFDTAGNPLQLIMADGTRVDWTYYPAEGSADNCPADPNGFVRFTRSRIVTPCTSAFDAPVRAEQYRYGAMQACQLADCPITSVVVLAHEATSCDSAPIVDKATDYVNAPSSSEHGRVSRITTVMHDLTGNGNTYSSSLSFDFTVDDADDTLSQVTHFSGHDDLTTSITRVQSCFSGRVGSESDTQGNRTVYSYDPYGRMVSRTCNPETEFENTTRIAYERSQDSATGQLCVSTTITDARGNALRIEVDGFGRAVRRLANDIDEPDREHLHATSWYEIDSKQYDAFGRAIAGVSQDYLRDAGGSIVTLPSKDPAAMQYDAWGHRSETSWGVGGTLLENHDPVAMTSTRQMRGPASARFEAPLLLGRRVTQYDLRHRPLLQSDYDATGTAQGAIAQRYDGAGRLRERTDELGHCTRYAYDPFGRVTVIILADGTTISKTYAPFSADTLVASVSVTDSESRTAQLGSQTFDSLKRLTQTQNGGRTYRYGYENAARRPNLITTPAEESINSSYIAQLDDALVQRSAGPITQSFTYDSVTGAMLDATENSATGCEWRYTPSGTLLTETSTSPDGSIRSANYAGSLRGRLQQVADVAAHLQTYQYDDLGRHTGIDHSAAQVAIAYDAIGRRVGYTTTDAATGARLETRLTLDDFSREVRREYLQDDVQVLDITQEWNPNWQLGRRVTRTIDTVLRDESFAYDCRDRLVSYACTGTLLNANSDGHIITQQLFSYDALDNLLECVSVFSADGENDTATFRYDNASDPTQLTSVTHTHLAYPATVTLLYDANGRLIVDDLGRSLSYDALGRLSEAGRADMAATSYGYDALNRLVTQAWGEGEASTLFYRDDVLANEFRMKSGEQASIIRLGRRCVGVASETASTLALVRTDAADSVLLSIDSDIAKTALSYPPYGDAPACDIAGMPRFVGERLDPVMGVYHLGNGYRAYNPRLMRFTCPDSLSPFGTGGMNAYAYCAGDPINHADPTGHMRWQAGVGILAGALGILFAVVSGGLAIAAEGSFLAAIRATSTLDLIAGASGIVADATGITSTALEDTNEQASADLAWVSLAFGLATSAAEFSEKTSRRFSKLKQRSVTDVSAGSASVLSSGSVSTIHADSADSVLRSRVSVSSLDSTRPSTTGFSSASSDDLKIGDTHRASAPQPNTATGPAHRSHREARAANSPDMGGHRASSTRPLSQSWSIEARHGSLRSLQDDGPTDARMSVVCSQALAQFLPLIHSSRASIGHWHEPEIPGVPSGSSTA